VVGQSRSGGIRRFALVLQQLSLNYDLPALNAKQIADLLPREFEPWKRRANWKPVEAPVRQRAGVPRVRFDNIPVGSQWWRSHLAELWGYGDVRSLRNALIAPRGQDFLVMLVTADEPTGVVAGGGEGNFHWKAELPRTTVRRLANATKEETPVHLFRRPQARTPFVYLGKARVGGLSPLGAGTCDVEFRLLCVP
jgi:hypothetical protein